MLLATFVGKTEIVSQFFLASQSVMMDLLLKAIRCENWRFLREKFFLGEDQVILRKKEVDWCDVGEKKEVYLRLEETILQVIRRMKEVHWFGVVSACLKVILGEKKDVHLFLVILFEKKVHCFAAV